VWIFFIWVIAMIIYFGWKWIKEKKNMTISKAGIRKYNRLQMNIGERLRRNEKYEGRHRKC
jgi:predicted negative regulator of RcsB-dependent stress response